jgi:hypothetical protein
METEQHMRQSVVSRPAVRQGLLFGVALGLVDFVRTLVEGPNGLTSLTSGVLGVAAFLIVAAGFVYLGVRVASATGRTGPSALAGLIAGLVVWAFYVVAALIVALPNQDTLRRQFQVAADQAHLNVQYTNAAALAAVIVSLVLAVFLGAGVGALLSTLGGLFGRRRATMRNEPPGPRIPSPNPTTAGRVS